MTTTIKLDEWLPRIQKEYLQDFVSRGGSAVKFIIPTNGVETRQLAAGFEKMAAEEGFQYIFVDSANAQIHRVDHLFFGVARQIDWDNLAYEYVQRLLIDKYKLPSTKNDFNIEKIAELNGRDVREMLPLINELLTKHLYRDYRMTQEFRIAMLRLCQHQIDPESVGNELCDVIKSWLKGEKVPVSALKPAIIFQKIGRHNARHMFFSLAHWLRITGANGLIIMLDIARYLQDRRPAEPDGTFYYSTTAVLDCYEVLRQFIDGTDESEYLFILVIAPNEFLNPDNIKRGINAYDALKLRIWDEVYDQVRANPLSSLVRVASI
jgi:hypothetical protein